MIGLPGYVHKLAYDFTVSVTAIGKPRLCGCSEVEPDGTFLIHGDPGVYHWVVYGKRAEINTEPMKKDTQVKGDGPYRYIWMNEIFEWMKSLNEMKYLNERIKE